MWAGAACQAGQNSMPQQQLLLRLRQACAGGEAGQLLKLRARAHYMGCPRWTSDSAQRTAWARAG